MANTSNTYKTSTLPVVNSIGANDRVVVLHSPDTAPNTVTIRQSHFISSVANSIVYTYANTTQAGIVKVGNNLSINASYHLNLEDPNFDYILESDTTFYVRTNGNDNNNGLTNDANGAFATLQKACDTMARVNARGHAVTIQVANGTYEVAANAGVYAHTSIMYNPLGASAFNILGNVDDPDAVVLYNNNATNDGNIIFIVGITADYFIWSRDKVTVSRLEGFSPKFARNNNNVFIEAYQGSTTSIDKIKIGTHDSFPYSVLFYLDYGSQVFVSSATISCSFYSLATVYANCNFGGFYFTFIAPATVLGTFITVTEFGKAFVYPPYFIGAPAAGPSSRKYNIFNFGYLRGGDEADNLPGTLPGVMDALGQNTDRSIKYPDFDYVLTSNTTFYVRTDGNDNNNGLTNTPTGAFATIQKACDTMARVNARGYGVTIQVANGTYEVAAAPAQYAHTAIMFQPFKASAFNIYGNQANPSAVVLYLKNTGSYAYSTFIAGWDTYFLNQSKDRIIIDRLAGFTSKFDVDNSNSFVDVTNTKMSIGPNICDGSLIPFYTCFLMTNSEVNLLNPTVKGNFETLATIGLASQFFGYEVTFDSATVTGKFLDSWNQATVRFRGNGISGSIASGVSSKKYYIRNFSTLTTYGTSASLPGTQAGTLETFASLES